MTPTDPHDSSRQMTNEQYAAKFAKDSLRTAAARLRRIAEDVDRLQNDIDMANRTGRSYGDVAGSAVSTVRNGLFNLYLENVVTYASQADIARAEARTGGEPS